tara:strand:- start:55457 stop:56509 length:1053 start_codon:yes stop_codon:yes gene_type:complete
MVERKDQNKIIKTLSVLGEAMVLWGENKPKESFNKFVAEPYFDQMNSIIQSEQHHNGWFTPENVRESLLNLGLLLTEENLSNWINEYNFKGGGKRVGLIMAGNIPLVGFHDFISTLLSGNDAIVKLSSDDKRLLPELISILQDLQPELKDRIEIVEKLTKVDAVIATGSNNSARYFEKYFGHLPNIIRMNRTSVAVLTGDESEEELKELGKDIFTYYGLGCRNVSHLLLPKDFDLDRIFSSIIDYGEIINHNKYANNYDYYKAIYLMNREEILENGFVLTRESDELFAPIAVLHYQRYTDKNEVDKFLSKHKGEIQAVVGRENIPFGKAQSPRINDYADGVDTMAFLSEL